jgi:hypothetical protein
MQLTITWRLEISDQRVAYAIQINFRAEGGKPKAKPLDFRQNSARPESGARRPIHHGEQSNSMRPVIGISMYSEIGIDHPAPHGAE